jgi:hypothetical protein
MIRHAATTDYMTPPWHLRLCWWLAALIWGWGAGCEELSTTSPELANPLWKRS